MKTIKSLLLKLDTDRLVNTYVYEYPFDYFMLQKKYEKVTLGEINKRYKKKVKEVIERLKKMEIKKVPEDEKMLVFAYRNIPDFAINRDIVFASCKVSELNKKKDKANSYGFLFTKQEEIIGFYVAETALTKRHIYELLAYVINELTYFGWNQEHLEEEEQKLLEADEEIKRGKKYKTFTLKKWEKKFGIVKETEKEEKLHYKISMLHYKYSMCSKKKEINEVLKIIQK